MVAAAAVLWAFDASIADFKLDDPCTVDLLVVDGRIGLLASDVIRLFARLDLLTSGNERPASVEQFDLHVKLEWLLEAHQRLSCMCLCLCSVSCAIDPKHRILVFV